MAIILGIDGTGLSIIPFLWYRKKGYDQKYANSFVRKLCQTGPNRRLNKYLRGPAAGGGGLVDAINEGVNHIVSMSKSNKDEKILLTGFSRGAAGVVVVANKLKTKKINVDAMLLFDCVDKHVFIDSSKIPNNVLDVLHIVRCSYLGSRKSFQSSALSYSAPTKCEFKFFRCTHGAIGGLPVRPKAGQKPSEKVKEDFGDTLNITFAEAAMASTMVWSYCQKFIKKHSFL